MADRLAAVDPGFRATASESSKKQCLYSFLST